MFFSDCEATTKGRPKLREHLRSHTQEKVVACPGCGGMYASNTKLFDHIIRQKDMDGKTLLRFFSCISMPLQLSNFCFVFMCAVGQMFQCSHCSKRFATERLLRDHMRTHGQSCRRHSVSVAGCYSH